MKKIIVIFFFILSINIYAQEAFEVKSESDTTNLSEFIRGKPSGVTIDTSVKKKSKNNKIKIRGANSLNSANQPKYVVDGVLVDDINISDLNPEDIESIEILKEPHDPPCYSGCRGTSGVILITTKSIKYDIEVMDIGYNTFLASQSPKEYYSLPNLKARNKRLVTEWNIRHQNPLQYSSDVYGSNIDYDTTINYGLDFEYKLYMFFQYMEKEFKLNLG